MDSFSLLFSCEVSNNEIVSAIVSTGAGCVYKSPRELSISRGVAYIWLENNQLSELPPSEFDMAEKWPLPKEKVLSVVDLLVRRNRESEQLALEIAHNLAHKLGGAISWDGMDYWKNLYNCKYVDQQFPPPCKAALQ